jgi:hypothetical protein
MAGAINTTGSISQVHAQLKKGDVLVVDDQHGMGGRGAALFSVNPATGSRTVLSDFSKESQGELGSECLIHYVAIHASGSILVSDCKGELGLTVTTPSGDPGGYPPSKLSEAKERDLVVMSEGPLLQ